MSCSPPTGELRQEVRREFDLQRNKRDLYAIKYNLSDGRNRLKQLQTMLAFTS